MTRADEMLRRMRELPLAGLDTIAPGVSLILAPHPDDESLGCGGLIAACCAAGRSPLVVIATDGSQSHPGSASYRPERLARVRQAEAAAAVALLGLEPGRLHFLGLPDTRAPTGGESFERAVATLVDLLRRHAVRTIFVTWPHDPHCDHVACHAMAECAARITGIRMALYPVWGWLLPGATLLPAEAVNGARLPIADYLQQKRRAIAAHASQYADLITDDPGGFRLPADLLAIFERPYEVFLCDR